MIISIINQKGGVGKTTTALNLGAALAEAGCTVTMIDLDLQRDLTSFSQATQGLDFKEASAISLQASLGECHSDITVIDCPPALGAETAAALKVSDLALVPVQAQYLALRGLARILETIRAARHPGQGGNVKLQTKVLVTMFDARARMSQEVAGAVHASGSAVFDAVIPNHLVFTKASLAHQSVLQFAPRSAAAQSYRSVAEEILQQHRGTGSAVPPDTTASRATKPNATAPKATTPKTTTGGATKSKARTPKATTADTIPNADQDETAHETRSNRNGQQGTRQKRSS
jgi:chromosome partitioning protein